jgi:hemoglobin
MRLRTLIAAATLTAALAVSLVSTTASARMEQATLYKRLGGLTAIRAVVNDFVGNVAADKRINRFFAKTNIPRLKLRLVEQICQGSGGPCTYKGKSMKEAHRGMGVGGGDFAALVEDLQKSLVKFKVPAREQGELIAILGPMRKDIVEKK